ATSPVAYSLIRLHTRNQGRSRRMAAFSSQSISRTRRRRPASRPGVARRTSRSMYSSATVTALAFWLVNGAEEHSGRRHARASACIPLPGIVLAPPAPLVHEASRVGIRWLEGKQMGDRSPRYRVGISGSYGGFNLGDEAILQAMIAELRRSMPVEITVFSRNPADTLARHDVERAIPVLELSRREIEPEIRRLDLFILGGGGILYDKNAATFLREVRVAEDLGVPVMIYAVGAGPLEDPERQRLVRECLDRAAAVTVREREAQRVLELAGVRNRIIVTADPAFLLEPEPFPEAEFEQKTVGELRNLVGVSVREPGPAAPDIEEEHYHAMLAHAADFMVDRYDADLVFVPMEPAVQDLQQAYAVLSRMAYARRAMVLRGDYTPGQLLSLASRAVFAVGMRLHFLMFAA